VPISTEVLIDTVIQENDDSGNGNLETVILFYIIRACMRQISGVEGFVIIGMKMLLTLKAREDIMQLN
jgi:hypothetical protein